MKLISMTDFVLQQKDKFYSRNTDKLEILENYALFLKQSLTLGMFVPCYDDGQIHEKPGDLAYQLADENNHSASRWAIEEYNEAKSKVLFERKPHFDLGVIKHHIEQGRNIEYLANFGSLKLTDSAIKQLGL